jgi:AAA+ ATPase superfamily predicted ATPase
MNRNPFKYGGVVEDPYFVNREKEVKELTFSLAGGSNIILYSPRRYGKTSLIKRIAVRLKREGAVVLYLDLSRVNSREQFLEMFYREVLKSKGRWEKTIKIIGTMVRSARPVIKIEPDGLPAVSFDFDRQSAVNSFSEILDLPEKLAGNSRWIVIFDEFQEAECLGGEAFEKELRAVIQHHQKVNYVLMGSKKHILLNMVTRKNRAFYNFGKLVSLKKIGIEEWKQYLDKGFKSIKLNLSLPLFEKLIARTDNIPYYVQYLAFELAECAQYNGSLNDITLEQAESRVLLNQDDYFSAVWESLSLTQQKTLKGLATDKKNVFTREFVDKHRIMTPSGVQRSIAVLMRKGIIDKQSGEYFFEDPFFRLWLDGRS